MSSVSYIGNVIDFIDRMQGKDDDPKVMAPEPARLPAETPVLLHDTREIRLRTDTVGKRRRALEVKVRNELI